MKSGLKCITLQRKENAISHPPLKNRNKNETGCIFSASGIKTQTAVTGPSLNRIWILLLIFSAVIIADERHFANFDFM